MIRKIPSKYENNEYMISEVVAIGKLFGDNKEVEL